jgi:hypothetical protein
MRWVYQVGGAGLALTALAAAAGLATAGMDEAPSALNTARLFLTGLGTLLAGCAISMRPSLPGPWLIGAGAALLANVAGLPAHWDSAILLARVAAIAAAAGAALTVLPVKARIAAATVAIAIHFGGILTATTTPIWPPWLMNQVWTYFYRPYLGFLYLNNAYHFYSPDPGPSNLMAACIKYDNGDPDEEKRYELRWVLMPRRPKDVRDPMAVEYFRRLALTEQFNQIVPPNLLPDSPENRDVRTRRVMAGARRFGDAIPFVPELDPAQYALPVPEVARHVIPSYARHIAWEFAQDGKKVDSIKLYRLLHRVINPAELNRGVDPYYPTMFRPYFLGEFTPDGVLVNSKDPMLYWWIPILDRGQSGAARLPGRPDDKFEDYLEKHAGLKLEELFK